MIFLNYNDDDENVPFNQRNAIWFYNPRGERLACAVYANGGVRLHYGVNEIPINIIELRYLLLNPGTHDITIRLLNPDNTDEIISEHSNAVRVTFPDLPRETAPPLTVEGNIVSWESTSPVNSYQILSIPVDPQFGTMGYARFVYSTHFDLSQMGNVVPDVRYYVHVIAMGDLIHSMHSNNSNRIVFMLE